MSARKRAIARQAKEARRGDGVRRVASPAGERRYGAPEGTPIGQATGARAAMRETVQNRLKTFVRKPNADPEEHAVHVDAEIAKIATEVKGANSRDLRNQEHALTDIVENKVSESGHHSEIPAFHKDKEVAADMWLTAVRQELVKRSMDRTAVNAKGVSMSHKTEGEVNAERSKYHRMVQARTDSKRRAREATDAVMPLLGDIIEQPRAKPAGPSRPTPPFMKDPKRITQISDDELKTYHEQMKTAANRRGNINHTTPHDGDIQRRAQAEAQRAGAEIYRRKRGLKRR